VRVEDDRREDEKSADEGRPPYEVRSEAERSTGT